MDQYGLPNILKFSNKSRFCIKRSLHSTCVDKFKEGYVSGLCNNSYSYFLSIICTALVHLHMYCISQIRSKSSKSEIQSNHGGNRRWGRTGMGYLPPEESVGLAGVVAGGAAPASRDGWA